MSRPHVEVAAGRPTAEELAALVAVLAAGAAGAAPAEPPGPPRVGSWSDPRAGLRTPILVGPGAWVASGRVRGARTRAAW